MKKVQRILSVLVLIGSCLYSNAKNESNLVAYYQFNGNANDESGNGNNGTVNGATLTTDREGNANSAYSFDGVNDYISIPHSTSLNISQQITLSCWIKKSSVAACYEDVFMKGADSYGIQFSCDGSGSPMMHLTGNGWRNLDSGFNPAENNWFHVAATYDGTTQKIYINGTLKNTTEWSGTIQANTSPLDIGYQVAGDNAFFNGILDDIRIYNSALSSNEIQSLYISENTSMVAYYPFNGNANDESGNGNNGTVNGATLTTDRNGNVNSAYNFDGANDYIRIPHSTSLNISQQITLSCWIKKSSIAACYEDVFMKGADSYGIQFSCDGNGSPMMHLTGNGWRNLDSGFNPDEDKWFHVIGTYDGTSQKIYINGTLKSTTEWSGTIQANTSPLDIGYQVAGDNAFFNGILDDIRIYNVALNDSEVKVLFDSENTSVEPEPGLVAYYPFNGNANDESGNGNHATVYGASLTNDRFGNVSQAYSFDGLNDYIDAGNFIKAENMKTISAWIKVDDSSVTQEIVSKSLLGRGVELLLIQGYVGMFVMDEVDNNYALYDASNLNGWTFVAGTHNGPKSTMNFYVNGKLVAQNIATNTIADAEKLLIGAWNQWDMNRYFAGSIDDIGIYNVQLTDAEILAIYESSKPVSVKQLRSTTQMAYPNPTHNLLYFNNNIDLSNANAKIFSVNGAEVLSKDMDNSEGYIDISHLREGLYLLKVFANDQIYIQRIRKD